MVYFNAIYVYTYQQVGISRDSWIVIEHKADYIVPLICDHSFYRWVILTVDGPTMSRLRRNEIIIITYLKSI